MVGFDNRLPENYPVFPEAEFSENNLIVEIGDHVIDRDGHMGIATTSNKGPYPNEFLRSINEGCFRGKYLGNADDSMWFANQCRLASKSEITKAEKWLAGNKVLVDWRGQSRLF